MTGTTLEHDWYTTETREEIYKEIVSAVKELHIAFGAGEDRATRIANIHAVKNTNKEFYRRINDKRYKINKTEKEKCMDCIKSLSRLDGITMSLGGLSNREHITKEIDILMQYFEELLEELQK